MALVSALLFSFHPRYCSTKDYVLLFERKKVFILRKKETCFFSTTTRTALKIMVLFLVWQVGVFSLQFWWKGLKKSQVICRLSPPQLLLPVNKSTLNFTSLLYWCSSSSSCWTYNNDVKRKHLFDSHTNSDRDFLYGLLIITFSC